MEHLYKMYEYIEHCGRVFRATLKSIHIFHSDTVSVAIHLLDDLDAKTYTLRTILFAFQTAVKSRWIFFSFGFESNQFQSMKFFE